MAVHVQILRKEENHSESPTGPIPDELPESGHQNGKIEGFTKPVTNCQNVNGEVTLSRNGSIRGNPLSCSNPVTIPGNPVNSCLQQLRHSEGSESAGSPRSREGSTPRFHCGSMESDFVLSKAPHSIHSSFDSISMMSSVSMEKLASKVHDAEAPVEVCKIMVLMAFVKSPLCRWHREVSTTLGMPTMVETSNMAATGQGGLLPPTVGWESRGVIK